MEIEIEDKNQKKDKKEIHEFIKLMQNLNAEEQTGLLLMIQGAKLLAQKKKQRVNRCSRS